MPWQTPKTDWTPNYQGDVDDINRIEGNIKYLYELQGSITVTIGGHNWALKYRKMGDGIIQLSWPKCDLENGNYTLAAAISDSTLLPATDSGNLQALGGSENGGLFYNASGKTYAMVPCIVGGNVGLGIKAHPGIVAICQDGSLAVVYAGAGEFGHPSFIYPGSGFYKVS